MKPSKLRQLLTIFETADSPLSLLQIARDLEVTPERLEAMIQHWVRKGKIKESQFFTNCGSCGQTDGCPFVIDMPRSYELAADNIAVPLRMVGVRCDFRAD